jgi:large subunit ribosomal protein L22
VEICRAIKGKKLEKAKEYLRRVIEGNRAVPFRRYKKGVAHRKGITKAYAGRYPVKAASQILKVLEDAQSNAEYKGLNVEKLFIKHIAARRGRVIEGIIPRAMGRASAFNTPTTNIEVILEEGR